MIFEITNDVFTVEDLKKRLASVGLPFDELESGADGAICLAFATEQLRKVPYGERTQGTS